MVFVVARGWLLGGAGGRAMVAAPGFWGAVGETLRLWLGCAWWSCWLARIVRRRITVIARRMWWWGLMAA